MLVLGLGLLFNFNNFIDFKMWNKMVKKCAFFTKSSLL